MIVIDAACLPQSKSDLQQRRLQLTLFFISSILAGFKAPVASPKSVNLTWPVPSTKKFCLVSCASCYVASPAFIDPPLLPHPFLPPAIRVLGGKLTSGLRSR